MRYRYWDQLHCTSSPLVGKFDVLLRGCFLYKDLPFLRVTFIDVEKSRRVIGDGIVREQDVIDKRTELLRHDVNCTANQPRLLTAYVTQPVSLSVAVVQSQPPSQNFTRPSVKRRSELVCVVRSSDIMGFLALIPPFNYNYWSVSDRKWQRITITEITKISKEYLKQNGGIRARNPNISLLSEALSTTGEYEVITSVSSGSYLPLNTPVCSSSSSIVVYCKSSQDTIL